MLFNDPWAVFGGGWAAPSAFIIATIGFTVFSVGYIAMARRVTAAGGFYSFASHGFGQTIGMGVALLIAACYLIFSAGVTGVTAYFANTTINDWFGVDIPVWVFEFGTLAAMIMFAFFHIELTAKILGVFLVLELIALLTFGICVLFQPAGWATSRARCCRGTSSTVTPTAPQGVRRRHGRCRNIRCLLVMDRLRDGAELRRGVEGSEADHVPRRPTSRSSASGVLYTFICWMLVVAWGKNGITGGVTAQFNGDIASVFYPQTDRVFPIDIGGASLLTRAFQLTIVTGSFACQLAFFNTATRYLFSMGREGILPASARAHASHAQEPARRERSSSACLAALIIGGFLLYDSSTLGALLKLGTWAPMMGNIGILAIMGLVSAGDHPVLRDDGEGRARHVVQPWSHRSSRPSIMFGATYLLIDNRNTLSGGAGIPFVDYMWVPPLRRVHHRHGAGAALPLARPRPLRRHRPLPARGRRPARATS